MKKVVVVDFVMLLIGAKFNYWLPVKTGMGSQILTSQTNKKLAR